MARPAHFIQRLGWMDGWLSLVIGLLRVPTVIIRTSLNCFKMTSKSVQDRNKQQGREEALFDQKQSPVAVTDMAPRYNTLVYNSMHKDTLHFIHIMKYITWH